MLVEANFKSLLAKGTYVVDSISSSLEDYVEAIYVISSENRVARVTEISKHLHVARSSVTGALKTLSSMDIVNYTPYRYITLTEKGEKLGREMHRRHMAIRNFFTTVLGINEEKSDDTACRMEHSMSREILEKLTHLIEFIDECPRIGSELVRNHMLKGDCQESDNQCGTCISNCLNASQQHIEGSET